MLTWTDKLMEYTMTALAVVYYTGALFYLGSVLSHQYMLTLVP